VQRAVKFVKYLPRHDWQATVLTVANPSVPVFDESLLADIPPGTPIHRARSLEPGYAVKAAVADRSSEPGRRPKVFRRLLGRGLRGLGKLLLQPDPQVLWLPGALPEGKRLLRQTPHDAIVVTGPPFSSFLLGAALSRHSGLPLVLDYRDEWGISSNYWENKRPGPLSRTLQWRMQCWAVRTASALLATTRASASALEAVRDQARSNARVGWIYNGFDPDDFPAAAAAPRTVTGPYRLVYTGTLWELTAVTPLVDAVHRLAETSPELVGDLELVFAGRRTAPQQQALERLRSLPCRLVEHPYLDHDRAVDLLRSADALCALLSDLPGVGRVVPAKIFEYMAARRPVLTIAPPGELWDLVQGRPASPCFTPGDVPGIASWLGDQLKRHQAGVGIPNLEDWDASRYDRCSQAAELAAVLESLCAVGRPVPRDHVRS
jgi:hypothetical protein